MDFTYLVASFIAVVVGLVVGTLFVALRWGSKRRLLIVSFGVSLLLAGVLLIDWSQISSLPIEFVVLDLMMVALYAFVGCGVGTIPPLAVRRLTRAIRSSNR